MTPPAGTGGGAGLPTVVAIFTGGTISMLVDHHAGGAVPALSGAAILDRTPGLDAIADVRPIDWGLVPASHLSFDQLFDLAAIVRDALADPAVAGAVLVQGTDTIDETSFFLDLLHDSPKPLVVVGAMRNAGDPDYDGPANLRAAVAVAASVEASDAGVVVVMAGEIHPADDVIKAHASAIDAFRSPNRGRLGLAGVDGVSWERARGPRRRVVADRAAGPIPIVTATVAMDGAVVEALAGMGLAGLVVEATGAGNTDPRILAACEALIAEGVPVVLTTRTPAGAAGPGYAFPGGGATWRRAGAMFGGHLGGPKARIALALGLGAGLVGDGLAALLADPPGAVAGADR